MNGRDAECSHRIAAMHQSSLRRLAMIMAVLFACCVFSALAGEAWTGGSSIAEGSRSPDGRFGILLPPREEALEQNEGEVKNFLVDLKSHAELAVIAGAHYYPNRNHRGMEVVWARDSSWCVVTYDGRFGFETVTLLLKRGAGWEQTDLGTHVQKALDAEIARQAGKDAPDCFATADFSAGDEGMIRVHATCGTNPKGIPEIRDYGAEFTGVFDFRSGKWIESEVRKSDDN